MARRIAVEAAAAVGREFLSQPESYPWCMETARRTPGWVNRVTVASIETATEYDLTASINRISPVPLLMVIADEDSTALGKQDRRAFDRAQESKKFVVVPARLYGACSGPKHTRFFAPQLEWLQQHFVQKSLAVPRQRVAGPPSAPVPQGAA